MSYLSISFQMKFSESVYVNSVSVLKYPNAGNVRYLAVGNNRDVFYERKWTSNATNSSQGSLFTQTIEVSVYLF